MKRALVITAVAGFIKGFLMNDIETLKKLGYEVDCAANANGMVMFDPLTFFNQQGYNFYQIDFSSSKPISKKSFNAYRQVERLLKDRDYDVVHCHTPIAAVIVRHACRKLRKKGLKVIYTSHGLAFNGCCSIKDKIIYQTVEYIYAFYTDAIITINNEDYRSMSKMHCPKVFKINGVGIDIDRYCNVDIEPEKYRESMGVNKDDILILAVGEISRRKNIQVIIKALDIINDRRYRLFICGKTMTGNQTYLQLMELIKNTGVNAEFIGYRHDIPELLHCAQMLVLPSLREGLGLAGVQALAAGLPVIGANVQGIKDYVINEETGYLCNPLNEHEFADCIMKLSDSSLREKMMDSCKKKSLEFSQEISKMQMKEIYDEVLSTGKSLECYD